MAHKSRTKDASRPRTYCYKIKETRDTVQRLTGQTRDQGGQRAYYYCDMCDAWHTTSKGEARPKRPYKRPGPGSSRRFYRH